jgi:hypothetical protein
MCIGKLTALCCQLVNIWCLQLGGAIADKIAEAEIIGEDQDYIGRLFISKDGLRKGGDMLKSKTKRMCFMGSDTGFEEWLDLKSTGRR